MVCCKLWSSSIGIQLKKTLALTSPIIWHALYLLIISCQTLTTLTSAPLTELHHVYCQNASEWHVLQRLAAIKGNKTIMLVPVSFANKVITPATGPRTFLTPSSGAVFGLLESTKIHCRLSAGNTEAWADIQNTCPPKPLIFLLCKYTGNKLYTQIHKENKCTWIFTSLWQRVKEVNQTDGNTHTKVM